MATSEGIPSSIDIEFLELNDNPYIDLIFCLLFFMFLMQNYALFKHDTCVRSKKADAKTPQ